MPTPMLNSAEPIAGYTLKERLGAGGYGEVWKVEAPGGLTKAMKFIYGRLGEQRAACELKALNRIKEVRHPFLLSLERIEVVDGQLVIITELAEVSLKDRFLRCQEAGGSGIPRDELLVYLGDAADALDYMSAHYSLQHLDVKPENLLVVGGRVKVADFGLVKDIHDATVSLLGGLTPVYASPEVYDGRPSLHSDQYSLAIVYQEMLTGVLPFPGRMPAQLAAQHLNSRPRLTPLPPADRAAIDRALNKDPDQRFPSCRAMVEALLDPEAAARRRHSPDGTDPRAPSEPQGDTTSLGAQATHSQAGREPTAEPAGTSDLPSPGPVQTQAFDVGAIGDALSTAGRHGPPPAEQPDPTRTHPAALPESPQHAEADGSPLASERLPIHGAAPQASRRALFPAAAPAVRELGPIEVSPEEARLRPTLLVGIGGTAARAFRRLRGRLVERFGSTAAVPAVGMLLVDTDAKTLVRATQGDDARALTYQETISVPLRPAHDYRNASKEHLNWLSRRWLYNVPRSLETEGIRPLGRLAMVDHSRQLLERFRAALARVADPQSLGISAKATGLEVDERSPRVLLVASISGGTGGGMVLDLGYAVRGLLAELGYADEGVCGVLAHSTPRHPNAKKLAAANAYACLSELAHFAGPGRYPGDPACGLPAPQQHPAPFHQTYLVPLGEDLDDMEFDAATALLAEYLYLSTVTTATAFFDRCRLPAGPPAGPASRTVHLRTFGLSQAGRAQGDLLSPVTKLLCRSVVERWSGRGDEQDDGKPSPDSEQAEGLHLTRRGLREGVEQIIRQVTGDDQAAYFGGVLERYFEHRRARAAAGEQPDPGLDLLRAVNAVLGVCTLNEDSLQVTSGSLQTGLEEPLERQASRQAAAVCQGILQQLDVPEQGINRACRTVEWFAARLRSIESQVIADLRQRQPSLADAQRALLGAKASEYAQLMAWLDPNGRRRRAPKLARRWLSYCAGRLEEVALVAVYDAAQSIRARVAAVGDQLADLRRELGHLADKFEVPRSWIRRQAAERALGADDPAALAARAVQERIPELAARLDGDLRGSLLARHGGLLGLLEQAASLRGRLLAELPRAARAAISRLLSEANIAHLLCPSGAEPERPNGGLRKYLDRAAPRLVDCGGARRLLALCPEGTDAAALAETIQTASRQVPTILPDDGGELILCYEVEQVPLPQAAAALIDRRPDVADIASRLHTRIDVAWTPLGGGSEPDH